jgi:N-acetylglutamate synthase-like GNAT family acetyltransferase
MPIKLINYSEQYLEDGRNLWVELTQHHRDLYDDQSIGGDNPGLYFDKHLEKVGKDNIFFAKFDGQIVGLVGLQPLEQEGCYEVEPVVVLKEYRGKGVGGFMLEEIQIIAKARGVKYLSIKPELKNKKVVEFYYNSGFKTIGEIELFIDLQDNSTSSFDDKIDIFGMEFNY